MSGRIPKIQFEKKIYEKLENLERNMQTLVKTNYNLLSALVPEAKPTKREIEILKQREKGRFISLEELEKRLRNAKS